MVPENFLHLGLAWGKRKAGHVPPFFCHLSSPDGHSPASAALCQTLPQSTWLQPESWWCSWFSHCVIYNLEDIGLSWPLNKPELGVWLQPVCDLGWEDNAVGSADCPKRRRKRVDSNGDPWKAGCNTEAVNKDCIVTCAGFPLWSHHMVTVILFCITLSSALPWD